MYFGNDVSVTCTCVLAYATAAIPQQNETADAAPATCKADATALKIHIRSIDNKICSPPFIPSPHVRNGEQQISVTPFLALHKMRVEAVRKRDLTRHDVIHLHHIGGGDGLVCGLVVRTDPWTQRPARASVAHGDSRLQLRLDHLAPHLPQPLLFCPIFGQCPVHVELWRRLVSTSQHVYRAFSGGWKWDGDS